MSVRTAIEDDRQNRYCHRGRIGNLCFNRVQKVIINERLRPLIEIRIRLVGSGQTMITSGVPLIMPEKHPQVFEINPKKYRTSGAYLGCLGLWAVALTSMAIVCAYHKIWFGFYFAAAMALFGLSLAFFQGTKRQTLVAAEDLSIFENDQKEPAFRIAKLDLIELSVEHVESHDSTELVSSLNLWRTDKTGRSRYILALWADESSKNKLKKDLIVFLIENGFNISGEGLVTPQTIPQNKRTHETT